MCRFAHFFSTKIFSRAKDFSTVKIYIPFFQKCFGKKNFVIFDSKIFSHFSVQFPWQGCKFYFTTGVDFSLQIFSRAVQFSPQFFFPRGVQFSLCTAMPIIFFCSREARAKKINICFYVQILTKKIKNNSLILGGKNLQPLNRPNRKKNKKREGELFSK